MTRIDYWAFVVLALLGLALAWGCLASEVVPELGVVADGIQGADIVAEKPMETPEELGQGMHRRIPGSVYTKVDMEGYFGSPLLELHNPVPVDVHGCLSINNLRVGDLEVDRLVVTDSIHLDDGPGQGFQALVRAVVRDEIRRMGEGR